MEWVWIINIRPKEYIKRRLSPRRWPFLFTLNGPNHLKELKKIQLSLALTIVSSVALAQIHRNSTSHADTVKVREVTGSRKASGAPVPYGELITSKTRTQHGFFNVHTADDRYYFEIPDSLLGRDILVVNRIVRAVTGSGSYAGDQIGGEGQGKVIRFERAGPGKINLYTVSYSVLTPDSTSPMFRAVNNSNMQRVAATFDIKSFSRDSSGSIIDITDLIMSGGAIASGSAKAVLSLRAYASNIEITAVRSVQPSFPVFPQIPLPNRQPEEGGPGSTEMNSSLVLLPKVPMQSRYFDDRVGYFTTGYMDYKETGIKNVSMICRWRLEPKEGDMEKYKAGELVEPRKPIIFYIDPATPKKWVPYLIQGVNDWEPVLERAGFKNAIFAREAPTHEEDSTWSLEDARTSAIVYKASPVSNAMGPNIHDPRSGEIIESHIDWYHNIMKMIHDWYMIQAGSSDPKARKMIFDDTLMGQLIRVISSHEVGHALGLRHNFGASSTVPVEKLRDKAWVQANGLAPSIMDYVRFNYVAQPEDSMPEAGLMPRIGDYDKWAVEWGYRLFTRFKSADEEKGYLRTWVTEKLKDRRLWWGDGEGYREDPRSQTEDLGDNAMAAGAYGIRNLQRIMPRLLQWTREDNENYDDLTGIYHAIIGPSLLGGAAGQFSLYISHAAKNIGGVYKTPRTVEEDVPVYTYVPKRIQKEAVGFLNKQLFTTPYWLLNPDILSRTGDNPLALIGTLQNSTLTQLFFKDMRDLLVAEAVAGKEAYTPAELLNDLKKGVWSELASHKPIDMYKRNLQKMYIGLLGSLLNTGDVTDISAIVRQHLISLRAEVTDALPGQTDAETRYHLQEVLRRIDKAFHPTEVKLQAGLGNGNGF